MEPKFNIPYASLVDEDLSKIQQMPANEKADAKNELLRSAGIQPTPKGPYVSYANELQKRNGYNPSNDIPAEIMGSIESNPFAKRFLMAISA